MGKGHGGPNDDDADGDRLGLQDGGRNPADDEPVETTELNKLLHQRQYLFSDLRDCHDEFEELGNHKAHSPEEGEHHKRKCHRHLKIFRALLDETDDLEQKVDPEEEKDYERACLFSRKDDGENNNGNHSSQRDGDDHDKGFEFCGGRLERELSSGAVTDDAPKDDHREGVEEKSEQVEAVGDESKDDHKEEVEEKLEQVDAVGEESKCDHEEEVAEKPEQVDAVGDDHKEEVEEKLDQEGAVGDNNKDDFEEDFEKADVVGECDRRPEPKRRN